MQGVVVLPISFVCKKAEHTVLGVVVQQPSLGNVQHWWKKNKGSYPVISLQGKIYLLPQNKTKLQASQFLRSKGSITS